MDSIVRRPPITLSLIYTEVARRLDLPVVGIGLPGHFIVRYAHGDDARYLDPFHRGCVLSVDDCRRLVEEAVRRCPKAAISIVEE